MKRSIALILMLAVCVGGFFALPALKQDAPRLDVTMEVLGVPGDTTIATVNGVPISAREYGFWVTSAADTLVYYNNGEALDWNMEDDGFTLRQAIEEEAQLRAKLFALVEGKFKELGLTLSAAEETELNASIEATMAQMGDSEEAVLEWLDYSSLSYEEFVRQSAVPFYYNAIAAELCDDGPATTAEVEQYISENDLLRAKHILFMTVNDTNGEPLDEATVAEKKALAEQTLATLQASTNLEADFDKLMHEHSEDEGLKTNPNGYVFTANNMVAEFENATRALEYGQMSGIVESTYGYHIILRLDPAGDQSILQRIQDEVVTLRISAQINEQVSQWMNESALETTELFDRFDPEVYYNALVAARPEV